MISDPQSPGRRCKFLAVVVSWEKKLIGKGGKRGKCRLFLSRNFFFLFLHPSKIDERGCSTKQWAANEDWVIICIIYSGDATRHSRVNRSFPPFPFTCKGMHRYTKRECTSCFRQFSPTPISRVDPVRPPFSQLMGLAGTVSESGLLSCKAESERRREG